MAQLCCYGKLWLVKAGNPRKIPPLRSAFSKLPTLRKFPLKSYSRRRQKVLNHVCACSQIVLGQRCISLKLIDSCYRSLRFVTYLYGNNASLFFEEEGLLQHFVELLTAGAPGLIVSIHHSFVPITKVSWVSAYMGGVGTKESVQCF